MTNRIPPNPSDYTSDSVKKQLRSMSYDRYLAYNTVKELVLDWDKMQAFKLGIIDDKGNTIKQLNKLSSEERKQFGLFDMLVLRLKRIIMRYNRSSLYSWGHALRLIREDVNASEEGNMDVFIRAITEMVEYDDVLGEDMGGGAFGGDTSGSVPTNTTNIVKGHIVIKHKTGAIFRRKYKKKAKHKKIIENTDMERAMEAYSKANPTHYVIAQEESGKCTFVKYGK